MSGAHPVQLDVQSPAHFDRMQLAIRLVIAMVLGWFGITMGWLMSLLYVVLPLLAAGVIATVGRDGYVREQGPQLWRVITWLLRWEAYMLLLVDRPPSAALVDVTVELRPTGAPTLGSALLRLVTSLPSGLVLALLGVASSLLWLLAALFIVLGAPIPHSIIAFQQGMLRWQARLLAYHASLVTEYPPWTLHSEHPHHEEVAC